MQGELNGRKFTLTKGANSKTHWPELLGDYVGRVKTDTCRTLKKLKKEQDKKDGKVVPFNRKYLRELQAKANLTKKLLPEKKQEPVFTQDAPNTELTLPKDFNPLA